MHILYLEDEPNDAALVARYVRTTTHTITIVDNIVDAQKALIADPALVLVDIVLGATRDGLTFMRALREQDYTQPVVAITALTLPQDIDECFASGCTEVILKPYAIGDLDRVFRKYVSEP